MDEFAPHRSALLTIITGLRADAGAMLRGRFLAKNRVFSVIFRGQISHAGEFDGRKFCTGIDSKGVKNNLQGFEGKFVLLGLGGGGAFWGGINREDCRQNRPGTYLTDWTDEELSVHFFYLPVCAEGE
jgi:hypothetical protein